MFLKYSKPKHRDDLALAWIIDTYLRFFLILQNAHTINVITFHDILVMRRHYKGIHIHICLINQSKWF